MVEITVSKIPPKEWNSLVASVPEGTVFQTTQWADFMQEFLKAEPSYILAQDNGDVKGMLLSLRMGKGHERVFNKPFSSTALNVLKKLNAVDTWSFGPLVLDKKIDQEKVVVPILEKTKGRAVLPPIHGNANQENFKKSFESAGFKAKPTATFLIDLTQDLEVLRKNIVKGTRKNIERCKKNNVIVEQVRDEEGGKKYYDMLYDSRKSLGLTLPKLDNFTTMWKHLHGNGNMEIFITKKDDETLAALTILQFNGVLRELGAARSLFDRENKIYGNDLLKWHIIEWGHNNGHRLYDLAGVSLDSTDVKEKGIYDYKAKWGGKLIRYYTYSRS